MRSGYGNQRLRRRHRLASWKSCAATGSLLALSTGALSAQAVTRVGHDICASCVIRLDTVARIDRATPVRLSDQARVTVGPAGEYFVVDRAEHPRVVLRYDAAGRSLEPIEIRGIQLPGPAWVDAAGRIIIPDRVSGEFHVVAGMRGAGDRYRLSTTRRLPYSCRVVE
jgi:hypothetical protein